jgi:hypothetical protein
LVGGFFQPLDGLVVILFDTLAILETNAHVALRLRIAFIRGGAYFLDGIPCFAAFLHEQKQDRAGRGKFKQVLFLAGKRAKIGVLTKMEREFTRIARIITNWDTEPVECGVARAEFSVGSAVAPSSYPISKFARSDRKADGDEMTDRDIKCNARQSSDPTCARQIHPTIG